MNYKTAMRAVEDQRARDAYNRQQAFKNYYDGERNAIPQNPNSDDVIQWLYENQEAVQALLDISIA